MFMRILCDCLMLCPILNPFPAIQAGRIGATALSKGIGEKSGRAGGGHDRCLLVRRASRQQVSDTNLQRVIFSCENSRSGVHI